MFKRFFSLSNPLGIAFTAAALILTLSPEARKGTRKVLIKGAAALLSVGDQVKYLTTGASKQIGHIIDEAKVEKEQMTLPDFSDMVKNVGESTKTKMSGVFDDMKMNMGKVKSGLAHSMEMGDELTDSIQENAVQNQVPPKKIKKTNIKNKKDMPINVFSDDAINSIKGKPPLS